MGIDREELYKALDGAAPAAPAAGQDSGEYESYKVLVDAIGKKDYAAIKAALRECRNED
jgi:hypothetical protein